MSAINEINRQLKQDFGADSLVITMDNYQLYLNHPLLKEKIEKEFLLNYLIKFTFGDWII